MDGGKTFVIKSCNIHAAEILTRYQAHLYRHRSVFLHYLGYLASTLSERAAR